MSVEKHFGLRIDDELLKKFRYACSYDDRYANSQILVLIKNYIKEFEEKHGEIKFED